MRGRRTRPAVAALVAVFAVSLGACAEGEPGPAITVTDSAGIAITLSPDLGTTYATLAPDPIVDLGGPNADGATQFYQITNVQLDGRGRIWVSDWQSGELRVFGPDGSHVRTVGGRGEGPGEFLGIRMLGFLAGDSAAVADQRAARVSVYGPDGELARTDRIAGAETVPRPFDVYRDGSILGQIPTVRSEASLREGELLADRMLLARYSADGMAPVVDEEGGALWLFTGRDIVPLPFTVNAAFDLAGDDLHFALGPAFRVRVYESDRLVRIYGVARDPQPVTERDVEAYRALVEDAYPEERRQEMFAAFDHPLAPTVLPAYTRLVTSDEGTVWTGRFAAEDPWDVYGPAGELLGGVVVPDEFYPMSIRGGRLAGVWRDELGVEHVRVYEVRR